MESDLFGRREFFRATTATTAALLMAGGIRAYAPAAKLKKAIKFSMINLNGSNQEKLAMAKKVGFSGVEIDIPNSIDLDDLVRAKDATGVVIHGVIDSVHWRDTLSSPDEAVRAKGLAALKTALNAAKKVGADTVLLVPGVVNKEVTYEQCFQRSQAEVRKVLPLAEKLGVKIAIEVVWNNFLTKPEQLIEYVDTFESPWVGAYFDCSNMIKYGVPSAEWIRKLGKRMLKFDFKGYSIAKAKAAKNDGAGFGVGIGDGDEDWPEVLKALDDVGYTRTIGWATAEVAGGGEKELRDVSERMDKIFGL